MSNHMSIPDARDRLRELAKKHNIPELVDIADAMYRRTATRRASTRSERPRQIPFRNREEWKRLAGQACTLSGQRNKARSAVAMPLSRFRPRLPQ